MNLFGKMSFLAILLWAIFCNPWVLLYYVLVVGLYTFIHYQTKKGSYPGVRRKIAIGTWGKIGDPAIAVEL